MTNKHVNAIIIGAGAGGGIVAKELSTNGLTVVLFEHGEWPNYDKNPNDELISQRTEVLGSPFGPDHLKNPRVSVSQNGTRHIVTPIKGSYNNNAACVGSGTVSYGAMAWRFMQEDFKLKSTYGHVEGSTLDDWPITYEDLEPFYEKAEWEIGVSGDDTQNPFAPPRKQKQPMPPFEYNKEAKVLNEASKRLGLHPFPIPMLRNSIPYNNRAGCIRNRTCAGFACPVDAKNGTQNTVIPIAISSGNCEIRTGSKVVVIMVNKQGKATGVKYFDKNDKAQIQTADIVVVAGAAIETARLLLNSKSKLFPNGAGNNFDWVGRNLMGHSYTGAYGLFDYDILDFSGPGASVAWCDFNHHNKGIIGGGLLANEFNRLPYYFARVRPPKSAGWGKKHKDFQQSMFHRTARVVGPIQEMPNFESRVTTDSSVKDYWGTPVACMSGNRHPLDHEHCKFLSDKAERILKEAGAYQTWQTIGGKGGPSAGQHQNGTARMGNDKKTSVVNKYGQVHEIDNLFVADGSAMVNGGGFNPVLTIMAIGYWVGNYIVRNFSGTRFK